MRKKPRKCASTRTAARAAAPPRREASRMRRSRRRVGRLEASRKSACWRRNMRAAARHARSGCAREPVRTGYSRRSRSCGPRTPEEPGSMRPCAAVHRHSHHLGGHIIEFTDADHAHGVVYSKNEHETGADWVIMQMLYWDDYERIEGRWYFRRRLPCYWYASDLNHPPLGAQKMRWPDREPYEGSWHYPVALLETSGSTHRRLSCGGRPARPIGEFLKRMRRGAAGPQDSRALKVRQRCRVTSADRARSLASRSHHHGADDPQSRAEPAMYPARSPCLLRRARRVPA